MKSLRKMSVVVVTAGVLALGVPNTAFASEDSYNDTVKELVRLNPGSSYSEMNNAIREEVQHSKKTPKVVANEALREVRSHTGTSSMSQYETRSSLGSQKTVKLQNAQRVGDIFYSPSSTVGVRHGHAGIYIAKNKIIEASGLGKTVSKKSVSAVTVAKKTQLMRVNTTQAKRNKAAAQAKKYIGRAYNYNFAFNKTSNGPMNCSQLVWVFYKKSVGIDLDGDGGNGVYPKDLARSKYTTTYKTL